MSSQYGERWPTNSWDRFGSLGHTSQFQPVSRLCFVTAPTSLDAGQPNFAWCLIISWTATLYIHFGGSCPLTEFCQVQNSLCVQLLRSPILAVSLYGTQAVGVSKTLRRGIFTRQGSHPVRNWAVKLSSFTSVLIYVSSVKRSGSWCLCTGNVHLLFSTLLMIVTYYKLILI